MLPTTRIDDIDGRSPVAPAPEGLPSIPEEEEVGAEAAEVEARQHTEQRSGQRLGHVTGTEANVRGCSAPPALFAGMCTAQMAVLAAVWLL